MITIQDIQTAVTKRLKDNGYTVFASEVREGFQKPACFVDVLPVSVELQNAYSELITDSVTISYYPLEETREEIIQASEDMKNIFLYSSLSVADRFLNINEIIFDNDKSALIVQFDIEFLQETGMETEPMPKMENLSEKVVTRSNGTS